MKIFKYWLAPLLWAGVIFTFSSMTVTPTSQTYWQDFVVKKAAHFVEYFILYTLTFRALRNTTTINLGTIYIITLGLVVLYATSDEFHQSFTPGREPSLRDILIDSFAGTTALISIWKYLPKAPKILKNLAKNFHLS